MKRFSDSKPVSSIVRREKTIDPKPEYQRGPVWSRRQKQLLIDTILRDLDIPKLYFRAVHGGDYEYEIVDGQQRLRAIWEFRHGKYKLAKDADPVDGQEIAGLGYEDLPEDVKDSFDSYSLHIIVLEDCSLDEVEEMFVRLQNGTTLKAAEKRNALPGNMKYYVRDLAQLDFFKRCGFENRRFDFDQIAAQCTLLELNGGPRNIRNTDLQKMYEEQQDFDGESEEAKKIRRVFSFLERAFPEKTPELKKFNVVSLYLLASSLLEKYVVAGIENDFGQWFVDFEKERRTELDKPEDQRDPEFIAYQNFTSHTTDSTESLEYRHKLLSRDFFTRFPDIVLKDEVRDFTFEQKLAIFRRDNGYCQLSLTCDGKKKMGWTDNWHVDHKVPHSRGGKTTVANGQLACAACNLAKGNEERPLVRAAAEASS